MQQELDAMAAAPDVHILGVNQMGHESANALICDGPDIPWLQEVPAAQAWALWQPTYRDVVIIDGENRHVASFNLTDHPLTTQANYDSLLTLLRESAP